MNAFLAPWEASPGLPEWIPVLLSLLLGMIAVVLLAVVAYALFSLPHRRLERARFFLDLLATGLARGRKPEDTILELARLGERELGVRFCLLAEHLERGMGLPRALEEVPSLLPPQVGAALRAGMEAGRLTEVIPACQAMLKDGPAEAQHLLHYLVVLFTASTPSLVSIVLILQTRVLPKFSVIMGDLSDGVIHELDFPLLRLAALLGLGLMLLNAIMVLGVAVHLAGPRVRRWLPPALEFLDFAVPWKRKRMLRDFTGSLAWLLDARVPEARALELAANTTANVVYQRRARQGMAVLADGRGLVEALGGFDPSGELRWRIANATRGGQPFVTALRGWREALDSQAFREEQGTAHVLTSALVLFNGLLVALVVLSLFGMLVQLIDAVSLW